MMFLCSQLNRVGLNICESKYKVDSLKIRFSELEQIPTVGSSSFHFGKIFSQTLDPCLSKYKASMKEIISHQYSKTLRLWVRVLSYESYIYNSRNPLVHHGFNFCSFPAINILQDYPIYISELTCTYNLSADYTQFTLYTRFLS